MKFCFKNEELCVKNEGFCMKTDDFCRFVTGGTTTNVARVKKSIEVTNGVVHIISAVLTPPADTRPSKQQGWPNHAATLAARPAISSAASCRPVA